MSLFVLPEALWEASAAIEQRAARMAAVHAHVALTLSTVLPPALDFVSLSAALSANSYGASFTANGINGATTLAGSGVSISDTALSYRLGDQHAAQHYLPSSE